LRLACGQKRWKERRKAPRWRWCWCGAHTRTKRTTQPTHNFLGELLLVLVELEDVLENWGSAVLPWEIEMIVDEFEEERTSRL